MTCEAAYWAVAQFAVITLRDKRNGSFTESDVQNVWSLESDLAVFVTPSLSAANEAEASDTRWSLSHAVARRANPTDGQHPSGRSLVLIVKRTDGRA